MQVLKEAKTDIVFRTAEELRVYLSKAKIYHVKCSGGSDAAPDFSCNFESGGLFDFQWGGSTLFFKKGDYWVRVFVAQIKAMYTLRISMNTVVIQTAKGSKIHITCEPK